MRTGIGLLAAGLLALAVVSDAAPTPVRTTAADPPVSVTYEGTLDTSWAPIMKLPDGRNVHEASYTWILTWRGRLSDLQQQPTQRLGLGKLSGTVKYTDNTSAAKASCTGGFRAKVEKITFTASVNESQNTLALSLRVPVSSEFLEPTNKTSLYEFCSEVVRWALPGNEMIPTFQFNLSKGGTEGRDVRFGPLEPNRERAHLEHSATVTVGASGTGGGSSVDMKRAARNDLRMSVERAKGPCLHLALALGVITTGAVWTSVGAAIPGGIPAGGAVIATGDIMASAVAPMCASLIEQIVTDYSIYKRDPPVSRAAPALQMPSCTRYKGAPLRTYCRRLEDAAAALVAAEHRVTVVLGRVQAAAGKLTAARKTGNRGRITAAASAARKELAALGAARASARAAGKKVASLVRSAGVRGKLTKAESAAVLDALLAKLARRGVPTSDLRAVAPAALRPAPVDVLAALSA